MRKAKVFVKGIPAGELIELAPQRFQFNYDVTYQGEPVSLTLPLKNRQYIFETFPAFFEGLLPEGSLLEALLRKYKLDQQDYFGQLLKVGHDVVGAVTIEEIP